MYCCQWWWSIFKDSTQLFIEGNILPFAVMCKLSQLTSPVHKHLFAVKNTPIKMELVGDLQVELQSLYKSYMILHMVFFLLCIMESQL